MVGQSFKMHSVLVWVMMYLTSHNIPCMGCDAEVMENMAIVKEEVCEIPLSTWRMPLHCTVPQFIYGEEAYEPFFSIWYV